MPEIRIISVGTKMPEWVITATDNYLSRLPKHQFTLNLIEIAASRRTATANIRNIIYQESQKVITAIPAGHLNITLDRTGKSLSSEMLAQQMRDWLDHGQSVALCIGGPEGFPRSHLTQADQLWSLSKMTFAHPVVRVMLAEQLFRAWSIYSGHPYHRGEIIK